VPLIFFQCIKPQITTAFFDTSQVEMTTQDGTLGIINILIVTYNRPIWCDVLSTVCSTHAFLFNIFSLPVTGGRGRFVAPGK